MQNDQPQKRAIRDELSDADVRQFIKSMSVKGKPGWVPDKYREGLAKELGVLVAAIGNGDPAAGLKRIKATLAKGEMPVLHEHRKRMILFPGEQPAQRHNWVAGWGEYLRFADKALDLQAGGRTGRALARWKRTELKRLVSIGQGIEPEGDKGAKTATALLRSWKDRVVAIATSDTRIEELWEALDETPISVAKLDDSSSTAMLHLGHLPLAADELPQEGAAQTSRVFVTDGGVEVSGFIGEFDSRSWARPKFFLGWLSYQDDLDVFVLPPHLRGMEDDIQDEYNYLRVNPPPEFVEWFATIREGVSDFPSVNYDEELGYGWFKNKFHALCGLYISIKPDLEGKPEIFISRAASEHCIPEWASFLSSDSHVQADYVDVVGHLLNCPSFSPGQLVDDFPDRARLVATKDDMKGLGFEEGEFVYRNGLQKLELLEDLWDEILNGSGGNEADVIRYPVWCTDLSFTIGDAFDSDGDRILFNRGKRYKFYPNFKFDENLPSAAPVGSVAAALIANAHASPEDRIANILRTQAEKIAKAGLTFVEGLRAFHQSAIDNM